MVGGSWIPPRWPSWWIGWVLRGLSRAGGEVLLMARLGSVVFRSDWNDPIGLGSTDSDMGSSWT
ncbi:hypothetical protein RchiOBHm_Chr1g0329931 [Rosa chinensis]|uniref:Uncharacterized protein n=1 Tax=Rosa chinensis TaxID=74649 RepID=A0A2P6SB94_ROSCH|nr:hypothetical protein RchiOBHm_Chr1g0329931 [Rosa chinensis]